MTFRPYPILSLFTAIILAALIALGLWQVQRAEWKTALIADFERASAAAPAAPETVLCSKTAAIGRIISPPSASGLSLRVFGHNAAGDAGWRLFQAVALPCAKTALAETGFEPLAMGSEEPTPQAAGTTAASRFLVEAWPDRQWMAAGNSAATNEWHWFDAPAMAAALGAPALDANHVLTPLAGMPNYLTLTPPSGHIGYAVTWFGMAIGLLVIYALFHARAGRLRFRKQGPGQS
jgi:surfeit locus 1 family protein